MRQRILFLVFCLLWLFSFGSFVTPTYAAQVPCSLSISTSNLVVGQTYPVTASFAGADLTTIRSVSWKLDLIKVNDNSTVATVQTVQTGQASTSLGFSFTPSQSGDFYLNLIPQGSSVTVNDCSTADLTITAVGAATPTPIPGSLCYDLTNNSAAGLACTEVACPGKYSGPNGYSSCQTDLAAQQPTATPDPGTATAFPTQIPPPAPACADYDAAKGICKKVDTGIGVLCTEANCFVAGLFAVMMSLSGGMATLIIIYAGYLYIISRGNPEQLQKAREMIISAIVGLLFIVFSFVLMETITGDILRLPGFDVFNQCNDRNNQC